MRRKKCFCLLVRLYFRRRANHKYRQRRKDTLEKETLRMQYKEIIGRVLFDQSG